MLDVLPPSLVRLLREAPVLRRAYLVGGCVRDWLRGLPGKDVDVEVFGVSYEELAEGLCRWGRTDLVGRSFGVLKLTVAAGETYDFSLPRRDSKTGRGHRGFAVSLDPAITPREAASRRDFTVNALMFDPHQGGLLDFFGGRADLEAGILRHVGPAFVEDPLRVLRGMQFAGRFGLTAAPETVSLCRSMVDSHAELAVERVREEWVKWAVRSACPSRGLEFLAETGWVVHYPELAACIGLEQDPDWHPEGDVFIHTGHCLDVLAGLADWRGATEAQRMVLAFAVLLHDVGKAGTTRTEIRGGRVRVVSPGHDQAGAPLAAAFLGRLGLTARVVDPVVALVRNHMAHLQDPTPRAVRRLAHRLHPATVRDLALVMTADAGGRPPRPAGIPPAVTALLSRADELDVSAAAPRPLLLGRHLRERGWVPGPAMGVLLSEAFEAQLDGAFTDLPGALAWLDARPQPGSQSR